MARELILFGGSFDPVHHGHLIVARALAEARGFARVTLVPAAQAPHKTRQATGAAHRLAMLRLAVAADALFEISEVEFHRPGPSYTVQTLRTLRAEHGPRAGLHWVIGADMLEDLASWREVGLVLTLAELVIAARPPWDRRMGEILEGLAGTLGADGLAKLRGAVVATPLIDISSTDIRARVGAGRSIRYLVPLAVEEYIHKHGLYQEGGRRVCEAASGSCEGASGSCEGASGDGEGANGYREAASGQLDSGE